MNIMKKIIYWAIVIVVYCLVALVLLDDGVHCPRWCFWTFTILYAAFFVWIFIRKRDKSEAPEEAHQEAKKTNEETAKKAGNDKTGSKPATKSDFVVVDGKDLIFEVEQFQFKMKHVSAGTFIMGEGEENNTPHKVTLGEDYWIGETPVTQALWQAVMGNNPSHPGLRLDNAPVGNVNWDECQRFIDKLSELTGQQFNFPTEAKWEFAARGGNNSKGYIYSGSDDIDDVAWYWSNCEKKAHAVKTKKPNELGIYDMSGIIWEWCFDWADKYDVEDDYDPIGPMAPKSFKKIIRGGSMENDSPACVTTARSVLDFPQRHPMVGLRLALFSIKGEVKKQMDGTDVTRTVLCDDVEQNMTQLKSKPEEAKDNNTGKANSSAPNVMLTQSIVWMAHCINLPFLSQEKNITINISMSSMLDDFRNAVNTGDEERIDEIYNKFQDKMKERLGSEFNNPTIFVSKFGILSRDLLDLYKMVIEGQKDENTMRIMRILKYSIEFGSPAKTLDTLTDFFVNNTWFDNMPEENKWLKLALECMMITGNEDLGKKVLARLQSSSGISDEEKEELLDHAREFRSQIDDSWM